MMVGFFVWSVVAIIFVGIGISCRKSETAVGFFTFAKAPTVDLDHVEQYNRSVSLLWLCAAVLFEFIGIPFLFAEQNSPIFILVGLSVMIWVVCLMTVYMHIEKKYKQ